MDWSETEFSRLVDVGQRNLGFLHPLKSVVAIERLNVIGIALWSRHSPRDDEALAPDCVDGECEHDGGECPTVVIQVCSECAALSQPEGLWDDMIPGEVIWPCATATILMRGRPDA